MNKGKTETKKPTMFEKYITCTRGLKNVAPRVGELEQVRGGAFSN
jgi:hypothetical protein